MSATLLRKPVNLSISEPLLQEARALKINMSQAAERGIIDALAKAKSDQWRQENAEALQSSNIYIEKNGLPLAKHRQF